MFQREARPSGVGAAYTIDNGKVQAAIARAQETYDLTDLDSDGTGDDDISLLTNQLAYRGVVTYS